MPAVGVLLLAAGAVASPGWSQWGGPTRDFKASSIGLAARWPASGPRELWSRPLGDGYSSIIVDGGTLYTMYRPVKGLLATVVGKFTGAVEQEIVVALEAATGKTLWEHAYAAPLLLQMGMEYGPGPHATPLVAGDLVYAVGVTGKLHALDTRTGRVAWARDLWQELGGKKQGRGYSCSPLAYGTTVIMTLGGQPGQALVAFDQKTGRVVWKNGDVDPSPSSPLLIDVDGQAQLVLFHADGVAGFDPARGTMYWNYPHRTSWGLNISTPVWGEGNLLFISSAYGSGSRGLELRQAGGKTAVKEVWFNGRMRLHHGNAIRVGDLVYGSSGDSGVVLFTAVDARTGQSAWQERGLSKASAVYAEGKLILLDEDGSLVLARPDAQGLHIESQAQVLSNRSWTAPTLVGTTLYVRDRADVKALDLR